ncbi:hypothetical protein HMN09_01291600 [Mycena chlorophos]|uniref:Uncharacterized protein n=1 Tax=Mycena chlorophos TaxID=658473 RepID=A0A8H6S1K1_MYCCL|nr:hypothetical protein HMN09_01291600 [Mycena chlorophos]
MHATSLSELPEAPDAEDPPTDFFLRYPYLLVWTDQVDVWRLSDGTMTHVCMLEEHIDKPWEQSPVIDAARKLLVIPEAFRRPPRLRIYALESGEILRDVELFGRIADVELEYRASDARALVLLTEQTSPAFPHGQTTIVLVDIFEGAILPGDRNLPPQLSEREERRDIPPMVLEPVFFGVGDEVVATSTTKWLGKVDLLAWGPEEEQGSGPSKTLELRPGQPECKSMVPRHHIAVDENSFVLCSHEDPFPERGEKTSVRRIEAKTLSLHWEAHPIPGKIKTIAFVPVLGALVLSTTHDITDHENDPERMSLQIETVVVVLDVETGEQRALHSVDSDAQQSFVVDVLVSADPNAPVLTLVWKNGDVLSVGLSEFVEDGFPRDSVSGMKRAQTQAVLPADVISASVGRRELIAVAGVRKHPVRSQGGSDEEEPDWDEDDGRVMLATW